MDQLPCKAVWKCVLVETGVLFVMLAGVLPKPWLLVGNWALLQLVSVN